MLVINNEATADAFTDLLTLDSKFGGRLVYVIANNSAIVQFRPLRELAGSQAAEYGPEQVLTPSASFVDKVSAARFRSAVAGSSARVIASLSEPGDILPASGTPFTQTLAASGGVSPQAGTVISYVTAFPVAAPADGDLIAWRVDNVTWPGVVWLLRYNAGANYWEFLGGNALRAYDGTNRQNTVSGTWQNRHTAANITIPRDGDYYITWSYEANTTNTGDEMFFGPSENGGIPTDDPHTHRYFGEAGGGVAGNMMTLTQRKRMNGLVAGRTLTTMMYSNIFANVSAQRVWQELAPIRVR